MQTTDSQNNHIGACFDCAYLHNLGKVLIQVRLHGVNFIPQALFLYVPVCIFYLSMVSPSLISLS